MRQRAGRKRKAGYRQPKGKLRYQRGPSPAEIAAGMPHRRALGEKAVDQLGESELGPVWRLRGELEPVLATAGADYARHWRGTSRAFVQSPCSAPAPIAAERWARCG
jgi:hypothetical protein